MQNLRFHSTCRLKTISVKNQGSRYFGKDLAGKENQVAGHNTPMEPHSRCKKKKKNLLKISLFSVHRSARKRNKKTSYQMETIPATDMPWFTGGLSTRLPLAVPFQLLGAPYSWDYQARQPNTKG